MPPTPDRPDPSGPRAPSDRPASRNPPDNADRVDNTDDADDADAAFPAITAPRAADVPALDTALSRCRACPRLVAWREEAGRIKRKSFAGWDYWARPVAGFGPSDAALLLVGLAPAAHGGNRTGRMFTGDRSGDVLVAALHDIGLANQAESTSVDDGLRLYGVRFTAPVHCAPPDNKPTPQERDTCRPWLVRELALLRPTVRAIVVLGSFGWQALFPALAAAGWQVPRPRPKFGHGVRVDVPASVPGATPLALFGSYHVSQQNTFTGRLTSGMLRDVLADAARVAGLRPKPVRH